ncbi:MAG: putative 2OG-Fe(II) oxygenase [Verrucomicrobiota bacterium]|jgi:hypothetical protein
MKLPSFLQGVPLRVYESHSALGCFAPVPFASVELSEQRAAMRTAQASGEGAVSGTEVESAAARAYLDYRFGKIQSSNGLFKSVLGTPGGIPDQVREFALLGAAATSTLQRDYAESNELLEHVSKRFALDSAQRRAVAYWRIRNHSGLGGGRPLVDQLGDVEGRDASWQLFELYSRDASFDRESALNLQQRWGLGRDGSYAAEKWGLTLGNAVAEGDGALFAHKAFALDHKTMLAYLDRHGLDRFLAGWREKGGGIPNTSEVLAALALFSIRTEGPARYRELYTPDRVVRLDGISLTPREQEQLVVDSVTSDLGIRDFNTSNFGGRTYTLDLSGNPQFSGLEDRVRACVLDNYDRVAAILADWSQPTPSELGSWFDASFTSGGSNIFPHLHTAGSHKTYYFTVVFYAQVPSDMKEGEGDLIFTDTDVPDPHYKKSPVSNRVKVVTGDLYAFPSYYFHSTTPSFTRKVRLTFNFDFSTDRKTLPLQRN